MTSPNGSDILQELEDARAKVKALEQRIKNEHCSKVGHTWESLGGCNAGCHEHCSCSVPVNHCPKCGDCDYGQNSEADEIRSKCEVKIRLHEDDLSSTE